jgi:hypothetical protein
VLGPLDADVGFIEIGSGNSFLGATEQLRRIATRVLTGGEIITWLSPCGSNCSYTVSFVGPAYKCQKLDSLPSDVNLTSSGGTPGESSFVYIAEGRYTSPSTVWSGSLDTQGLWIVRGIVPDYLVTQCQLFESTYTIFVQYLENLPVISTTIAYKNQIPGSVANSTGVSLNLTQTQWSLFNLFAIEEAVAEVLSGAIFIASVYGGFGFENTLIAMSDLAVITPINITYPPDFEQQVEDLLINTTLSVFYFLNNPTLSQIDGSNVTSPAIYTPTEATIISYPALYAYSAATLWKIYGTAIAVSVICIAAGFYMLAQNGVDADMSFLQIVVTTRNETLDRLCHGAWLGGEHVPKSLRNTELKFGELRKRTFAEGDLPTSEEHAGFGLKEEVVDFNAKDE